MGRRRPSANGTVDYRGDRPVAKLGDMAHAKDPTEAQIARNHAARVVSFVAYYCPQPERPGDLVRSLLEMSVEALGNLRVSGELWRRLDISNDEYCNLSKSERERYCPRLPNTLKQIGASAHLEELNAGVSHAFRARQQSIHRLSGNTELVWYLHYEADGQNFGYRIDPYVHLYVTLDRLTWRDRSLEWFVEQFFARCAAAGSCFLGLADTDTARNLMWNCYHDFVAGSVSLQRKSNELAWLSLEGRRSKFVRELYWGNLFSALVVDRFGGFDALRAKWLSFRSPQSTVAPWCLRMPGGGAFLTLTHSPLDLSLFAGVDYAGIAWLRGRLRDEGLLA